MAVKRLTRKNVVRQPLGRVDLPDPDLLPGEFFGLVEAEARRIVSDEELNIRYAKGEVRIVTESARYSLAGILSMLKEEVSNNEGDGKIREKRYKLDPEYQRRHRWSSQRKSRLIESFLLNVPVPPVFLYERDLARYEVMDGRQRLTALADFYDNKFRLEGMEYWPDLNGRTYSDLPTRVRDGIDRRYISSIILLKETAATEEQAALLKKLVFERLNAGGVELSPQETRNAVYPGPLNQLCLRLSDNEKFRRMWGIPNPAEGDAGGDPYEYEEAESDPSAPTSTGKRMYEKMEDVELVLRFFAYRHIQQVNAGLNRVTEFLDTFLQEGNKYSARTLNLYEELFTSTIDFLWDSLGENAFAVLGGSRQPRPTKIVYDPLMFAASASSVLKSRQLIKQHKKVLHSSLVEMYHKDKKEEQPSFSGRRTNSNDIVNRNFKMKTAFDITLQRLSAK